MKSKLIVALDAGSFQEAVAAVPCRPLLPGVTGLANVGGNGQEEVLRLAKLRKRCGLNGVIASSREIHPIREMMGGEVSYGHPGDPSREDRVG